MEGGGDCGVIAGGDSKRNKKERDVSKNKKRNRKARAKAELFTASQKVAVVVVYTTYSRIIRRRIGCSQFWRTPWIDFFIFDHSSDYFAPFFIFGFCFPNLYNFERMNGQSNYFRTFRACRGEDK